MNSNCEYDVTPKKKKQNKTKQNKTKTTASKHSRVARGAGGGGGGARAPGATFRGGEALNRHKTKTKTKQKKKKKKREKMDQPFSPHGPWWCEKEVKRVLFQMSVILKLGFQKWNQLHFEKKVILTT